MSTEIIDFKTPSMLFELEVRGFVVLGFDLHATTLIELAAYEPKQRWENNTAARVGPILIKLSFRYSAICWRSWYTFH